MLAKKTYKNQITIPKDALKGFEEVEYFDVFTRDGQIILRPVVLQAHGERLVKIRQKIRALGMKETDIDEAIRWARSRAS
jgi:hypothetical protein